MSFDAYDSLVTRKEGIQVSFEDWDVMLFMAMCDWKHWDVKLYGDVILSMVRDEMV